ncbi:MAG: hypothetical protein FJ104_13285 [Deltaproteobacteria bacterium]|nr:hypothetical protein [Deltaproteobacteria bacterium]
MRVPHAPRRTPRARAALGTAASLAALLVAGCVTSLAQHAAFARAEVLPRAAVPRDPGDTVGFELRPRVTRGSEWIVEAGGAVRFAGGTPYMLAGFTADGTPLRLEALVRPFPGDPLSPEGEARPLLRFGLADVGAVEPFDAPAPVACIAHREIAAVTTSSSFSLGRRPVPLAAERRRGRTVVTFQSPVAAGEPRAPRVRATLLETAEGRRLLYAEIVLRYGALPLEPVGHEVELSVGPEVSAPFGAVVVTWATHGVHHGPFEVHRLHVDPSTLRETPQPLGVPRRPSGG